MLDTLTDMLMALLLFAVYCVIDPALEVGTVRMSRRRIGGAGLLLGLAILTKGPVAVVLLGLAVAVPAVLGYNWLVRRNRVAMENVRRFGSGLQMTLLGGGHTPHKVAKAA